jgi:glycosyltransferase involved in cell wall biosynthesis
MKKIKILAVQTSYKLKIDRKTGKEICYTSAVDYYRNIQPLKYLPKDKFEVDFTYEPIGQNQKFKNTADLAKYYDVLYLSYMDSIKFYIELRVQGIKYGMKMVLDLDDNIWAVDPSHPYYKGNFEPGSEKNFNRSAVILDVDAVTTTNSFLRYKIVENTSRPIKDISIIPNFIDLTLFDYKKIPEKPNKDEIQIGYLGGASHFPDINKREFTDAVKIIMDKYPQVRLKTTFYMPQLKALFGYKYRYTLGRANYDRYVKEIWPKMMAESDILVAPLSWSNYSRAKSYIKYLEMCAGKKPMICEKIDPYNEVLANHPERGLQASTTEDWVNHFTYLIENPDKAKEMGEEAYKYVKENHTIQGNVDLIANYFEKLTDLKS